MKATDTQLCLSPWGTFAQGTGCGVRPSEPAITLFSEGAVLIHFSTLQQTLAEGLLCGGCFVYVEGHGGQLTSSVVN